MTPTEALAAIPTELAEVREILHTRIEWLNYQLHETNRLKLIAIDEKHQAESRAKQAEEKLKASGEHCATCICARRAPVQGEGGRDGKRKVGPGTISWEEHLIGWSFYAATYGTRQTAERMAQRGGFGYWELTEFLGHEPKSWQPR